MAAEVGSDIALIQDEDMLRKMWQQTEDFGKKKEIRMRMYKLREQRLKEFYTTGEMIETETTSKRSSTRTHTESITDRGFMTMKTKEIRDSESPTEEYQRQSNTNKNYYASPKNDESDGGGGSNRTLVQTEHVSSAVVPANEEYTTSSRSSVQQTSSVLSSSTSSRWESSSQTVVAVSAEEVVQKADEHFDSSKYIVNEQRQSNDDRQQLTYDNKSNVADSKATEYDGTNAVREVVEREDNSSQYSTRHGREKSYSSNTVDSSNKVVVAEHRANVEDNSQYSSNRGEKAIEARTNTTGGDVYEVVSENAIKNNTAVVDNTTYTTSDVSRTDNVEAATTDHSIINELQKLDTYLSTQHSTTDASTKSKSIVSNDERPINRPDNRSADTSRERAEGQYVTTYQNSYQTPRISVDVSPSHEAFARSLRSTPERSSPSPNRERGSPERRFKSASPEKYRSSPEKSASPPKSLKSATRRKLSSTQTKGLSKKRANTPTRAGDKYGDSSDDSDCSGGTHGTYDKYKSHDAKRALFKEETKISTTATTTSKYGHKSPSVSPVRREKSPGYSSEGSVAKEVRKSSSKVRAGSSHESSPERSAFKPVKNYKAPTQTHTKNNSQDNKINIVTREENNVYTSNYNTKTKNNKVDVSNFIKVIKPDVEENVNGDEESTTRDVSDSRKESVQKNFITEEQMHSASERADNTKITKEPVNIAETNKPTRGKSPSKSPTREMKSDRNEFFVNEQINVTIERTEPNREKSPSKSPTKEYKSEQDEFIVNEKINVTKERKETNDVEMLKPRERSPVKESEPETKDAHKTRPTAKSPEKKSSIPSNKSATPSKNAPATKAIPSSIENTPSKSSLIHRDSRDNLSHNKTVKKDLSKEKIDTKIARNDSKTLMHKNSKDNVTPKSVIKKSSQELLINKNLKENVNSKTVVKKSSQELILNKSHKENVAPKVVTTKKSSQELLLNRNQKENITPKTIVKKPSQELLLDKKTTISFRNKVTSSESKPKSQEPIKSTVEKKEMVNKIKPTISPQSSQKKLGIVKPSVVTKTTITDYKRGTENSNLKKIPTTTVTKPKTFAGTTKPSANDTPSMKGTKTYSKTTSSYRTQIKKTVPVVSNKTARVEVTRNVAGQRPSNDLEDELPPNHFESDTDLDDSPEKPKNAKNQSRFSDESSESSSSSEDEEDTRKIKELDNIRIEAEEEYGRKMTNKDGLLNVIVQLPPSSRESSPEYSARFGQPYCSVSDDASLPRYADVVSEPEDVNDYRLHGNRYDMVTDLDEETNVTVADRVSKFLHNINKQEEIQKTAEVPQSPRAVRKAKQLFESIAKGQGVDDIGEDDEDEHEVIVDEKIELHESPKNVTSTAPSPVNLLTRKISGAADYKSRKDFFEKKTFENKQNSNDSAHSSYSLKIDRPAHSSVTKTAAPVDNRSAPSSVDKTAGSAAPRTRSPQSKNSSPDRTTKSPARGAIQTETFDVKIEEINKARRLSGSKTVKDRKSAFERHEVTKKPVKDSSDTITVRTHQTPRSPANTGRISERYMKSVADTNSAPVKRVTSPNRNKKIGEKPSTVDAANKVSETPNKRVGSKSPDRKIKDTAVVNKAKSPEKSVLGPSKDDGRGQRRVQETQRTTVTSKTEFGVTVKSSPAPKSTAVTTKSASISNTDEELQIEEIFDLQVLEIMLEKAVGYDRRRRIRAQIRVVKRQLESTTSKETVTTTRTSIVNKSSRGASPVKSQKQNNVVVQKTTTEYVKRTEVKKERSVSPQKSYAVNPTTNSRSPSPQKSLRSVEETRSPLPAQTKTTRPVEKARSPSPRKTSTAPVEKIRSPSPQKNAPVEKSRSPSPKKMSVAKQQHLQDARTNKYEKSAYRNSTSTTISTTVASTTRVKSEQVGSNAFQEQNVTDLITSSYGVGPTDDNGRPLFGLRALRKQNTSQQINANDSSAHRQVDTYDSAVSSDKKTSSSSSSKPRFGLKALQGEYDISSCTTTVQESSSRTVHHKVSEQKGGVDQLITDHKGKPLFGLKALQSIGKNEEEPIYEDMPEPPVSPQLKELVLKHEKHAKESSKLESQPRQKPKAKFRDSFILDNKDEGLYSTFQQNGYTEPNSITLRSIIKKPEDDQSNETVIKSKSQSTVFQSKSVMRSDESGNVSVTQDFLKGEVSSVNDQEPSGKVTRGHYSYQSPDNADSKKGIAKVTTVTTAIGGGGRDTNECPEITDITEEFDESDRTDGNKSSVKRSRTSDKFETIQKRFSQESFDQDSRRSSRETNGYEKTDESSQSTPRSSLVRGDSIKALQHKFQQATVSSSLKQNKTGKSDSSGSSTRQVEEKTVTSQHVVNTSKSSGTTSRSFLDDSSRVTDVQDVLTRMRNADLVVESGDTDEDIEARALLNKFLGASVILHGMEQAGRSPTSSPAAITTTTTASATSSASLVNQVEKQRAQKSPVIKNNLSEEELDNIWDEKQLQILLESSPDYNQRRKIRARLRQIMAEHKEVTESASVSSKTESAAGSYVKTEVHTRTTTSSNRLTKANSVSASPFAKFQQLERQNSAPNSQSRPCYKFTDPALARSASSIKDRLLNWVRAQTKEYKNLQITNFSTCWSDGLAFCALIHHFYPEAFDYYQLKPENRRENFEIAFKVAEDEAGIAPLLDVEDMVVMRKPDWKCVFTYVQTFYRRFHNAPEAAKPPSF